MIGCRTSDGRDDGPNHFMMGFPREFAALLMKYLDAYLAAKRAVGTSVHCVEIFYSAGEWGNVAGLEVDRRTQDWVALPWDTEIEQPESVEFETVKVMEDGVVFSASWKNDDSGVYFETPVLPWRVIRDVAQSGEPSKDAFPAATIDMEENAKLKDEDEEDAPLQRNYYRCYQCQHEWEDEYNGQPDDDCPECEARHCSPYKSELVNEEDDDERDG